MTLPIFPGRCTDHRIEPVNSFADMRVRQKLEPIHRYSVIPDTVVTSISDPAITVCR